MLKRQSDELDALLEALVIQPMTKLSKRKLKYFYGMERLSKNIWRDIRDRIAQFPLLENAISALGGFYIIEDDDDVYIIHAYKCKKGFEEMEQ
jgi:hypothetical protein